MYHNGRTQAGLIRESTSFKSPCDGTAHTVTDNAAAGRFYGKGTLEDSIEYGAELINI